MEKKVEEKPFLENRAQYLVRSLLLWQIFKMAAHSLGLLPLRGGGPCFLHLNLGGLETASTSHCVTSKARS